MRAGLAFVAAVGAALFAAPLRAEPKPLAWDDAFSLKGAPAFVHVKASYTDGQGRAHTLEMWREGDKRLRRTTDGALDLLVEKDKAGEYVYRLVDRKRKALIEVNRTSLYRIGVFSDWGSLAGMLARPTKGSVKVERTGRPAEVTPVGACSWVRVLRGNGAAQEVCWSKVWRLPLKIRAESPKKEPTVTFQITEVTGKPIKADVFAVDTAGLAVIHADEDISPTSD